MEQLSDQDSGSAVVCIFCGMRTPVPERPSKTEIRVIIVRCHQCGKEAPYPGGMIVPLQGIKNRETLQLDL